MRRRRVVVIVVAVVLARAEVVVVVRLHGGRALAGAEHPEQTLTARLRGEDVRRSRARDLARPLAVELRAVRPDLQLARAVALPGEAAAAVEQLQELHAAAVVDLARHARHSRHRAHSHPALRRSLAGANRRGHPRRRCAARRLHRGRRLERDLRLGATAAAATAVTGALAAGVLAAGLRDDEGAFVLVAVADHEGVRRRRGALHAVRRHRADLDGLRRHGGDLDHLTRHRGELEGLSRHGRDLDHLHRVLRRTAAEPGLVDHVAAMAVIGELEHDRLPAPLALFVLLALLLLFAALRLLLALARLAAALFVLLVLLVLFVFLALSAAEHELEGARLA